MIDSNQTFIIAAYAVTWVAMLGYLMYLARRAGRARVDYERTQPNEGGRP